MGTSTDVTGPKGGDWAKARSATTRFAKSGNRAGALSAFSSYVSALGGAGGAAAGSAVGSRAGGRVANFVAGFAQNGLSEALDQIGLGHLIGEDRLDVLEGVLEYILGDDEVTVAERAAATQAALETLNDLFDEDASTFSDLEATEVDEAGVERIVETYLANWVFNRDLNLFQERLLRHPNAADREQDMRIIVSSVIHIELDGRSPLEIDWTHAEGGAILDNAIREAYTALEEGEA